MSRENFVIKLSDIKTSEAVYVNPSHIVHIKPVKDGTEIGTVLETVVVKETVEQIQRKGGQYAIFKIVD